MVEQTFLVDTYLGYTASALAASRLPRALSIIGTAQ